MPLLKVAIYSGQEFYGAAPRGPVKKCLLEVSEVLGVPGDEFLEEVLVEGLVEGRGRVAVGSSS
jgi:hypothetical protein